MKALLEDTSLTLRFEESLLSTTVKRLHQQFSEIKEQTPQISKVIFDISQVEMIDSLGLNFIIGMFNEAKKCGTEFRITGASQANKKLFELVNLNEYVPVT